MVTYYTENTRSHSFTGSKFDQKLKCTDFKLFAEFAAVTNFKKIYSITDVAESSVISYL